MVSRDSSRIHVATRGDIELLHNTVIVIRIEMIRSSQYRTVMNSKKTGPLNLYNGEARFFCTHCADYVLPSICVVPPVVEQGFFRLFHDRLVRYRTEYLSMHHSVSLILITSSVKKREREILLRCALEHRLLFRMGTATR